MAVFLQGYGVATMCPPWPIVAFGNVLLPRPLGPASRGLGMALRVVIKGWMRNAAPVLVVRCLSAKLQLLPNYLGYIWNYRHQLDEMGL